jgi:hypothetical protein
VVKKDNHSRPPAQAIKKSTTSCRVLGNHKKPNRSMRNSLSSLKLDIADFALKSSLRYRKITKKIELMNWLTTQSQEPSNCLRFDRHSYENRAYEFFTFENKNGFGTTAMSRK